MPDRNKSSTLHDNGIQVIYGNTRSFNSNYRKKQYLMNNAQAEKADLILVIELGFVDGAQPYIDGYEQCENEQKHIEKKVPTTILVEWLPGKNKGQVPRFHTKTNSTK